MLNIKNSIKKLLMWFTLKHVYNNSENEKIDLLINLELLLAELDPKAFEGLMESPAATLPVTEEITNVYDHIIDLVRARKVLRTGSFPEDNRGTGTASQTILLRQLFVDSEGYEIKTVESVEELIHQARELILEYSELTDTGDPINVFKNKVALRVLETTTRIVKILLKAQRVITKETAM